MGGKVLNLLTENCDVRHLSAKSNLQNQYSRQVTDGHTSLFQREETLMTLMRQNVIN